MSGDLPVPRDAALLAWSRRLCASLALVALGGILALTLVPVGGPGPSGFQWRLFAGEFDLADILCNVALFVPLAVALRCSGIPAWKTVALGCLLSATIEFVQLRVVPGRDSSLSDILSNTLGALVGVILVHWLPTRRRGGGRSLAAALLAVSAMAGTGYVLLPSFPSSTYYGQWTADLGQYEWYRGRVLDAEIGGMALPTWRLADSKTVRDRLAAGTALRVRAVAGLRTERLAPIFSIFDAGRREIILVGPDRDDLVLHVSTRTVDLRLQQPDLRWRGAMVGVRPGDTLRIDVLRKRGEYCVRLNDRERCGLAPTAGRAWTLVQFVPHLPARLQSLLDAVFLFLLGLPLGLVFRRGVAGYTAVALALGGLLVLPPLVGLAPTPLFQVAALALGILGGAIAPALGGPAQDAVRDGVR